MNTLEEKMNEWKEHASSMSFYNAAEGDWRAETDARNRCRASFRSVTKELMDMGVTMDELKKMESGYLISSSDYTP
jgi:hypothetical protein